MSTTGPYYVEANPSSPVAVCTLSSRELLETLAASEVVKRVAIIGPLETENIGIERMVITLLERPRIRWLIVCGEETRGRYQAQALRSLFAHGADAEGRIEHARSKRGRLPTLREEHVQAVRRQVRLRDLVGSRDLAAIREAVEDCWTQDPGPFEESHQTPQAPTVIVPSHPYRLKERDPVGFFIVLVDRPAGQLLVEHYTNDGVLRHRLAGPDAESLCSALIEGKFLSQLDHAAYLGRELAKAESALRYELAYEQDEPLGQTRGHV